MSIGQMEKEMQDRALMCIYECFRESLGLPLRDDHNYDNE